VLYALCTGHPPFRTDTALAVLMRVCDDTPRPIRETNLEIPEWLAAVVARLQAKDRGQRFATAADVVARLSRHLPLVTTGSYYVKSFRPEGAVQESLHPLSHNGLIRLCFKPPE